MSMLPCRVLCLLAIVFCCVGVAHADALSPYFVNLVKEANELAEKTSKLKVECDNAATAARQAGEEAHVFANEILSSLDKIAADPKEVEERKSKGQKLIDNATKAAEKAEKVRDETSESARATEDKAMFPGVPEEKVEGAKKAAEEADKAVQAAINDIDAAKTYAKHVEDALQKLETAVSAAKEKKEKQLESQEQIKETSLGEQQGLTEGNKVEQTQEKQKQHYRSTVTINIHGDNLDALLNGAANNSGMALNDGSSSPALLRVQLLLLLLLSVLGCMAVC
ncbi:uncharacterized protein TM35_000311520 [Trypanosoma theileri]|uniref:Surface protein TolT n=1 Tax=Trypanosoma theileri TaxID=67003 RepID=A0A1X0NML7_9TRYP|nr:uncharacterized protein TM35_000311520 [Trypanosoma theileri]ORC85966.1 hypothetical protein TM35_000311520 [Trypanosoma theileri]